jgi:hypothetical protein
VGAGVKAAEVGSDGAQAGAGGSVSIGVCAAIEASCRLERTVDVDRFCFKVGHTPRRRRARRLNSSSYHSSHRVLAASLVSYKVSLEKRSDMLGRDQNGDRWHRSLVAPIRSES